MEALAEALVPNLCAADSSAEAAHWLAAALFGDTGPALPPCAVDRLLTLPSAERGCSGSHETQARVRSYFRRRSSAMPTDERGLKGDPGSQE